VRPSFWKGGAESWYNHCRDKELSLFLIEEERGELSEKSITIILFFFFCIEINISQRVGVESSASPFLKRGGGESSKGRMKRICYSKEERGELSQ
jgi:hypothetical protein